jgi:hypothetical protein
VEGLGENILRRDAAVGENGVVVEVPGQPTTVFPGVAGGCKAGGEEEQNYADRCFSEKQVTIIFHLLLFRGHVDVFFIGGLMGLFRNLYWMRWNLYFRWH